MYVCVHVYIGGKGFKRACVCVCVKEESGTYQSITRKRERERERERERKDMGGEVRSALRDVNAHEGATTTKETGGRGGRGNKERRSNADNDVSSMVQHETTAMKTKDAARIVKKVYARRREKGSHLQRTVVFEKQNMTQRQVDENETNDDEKENDDDKMTTTRMTTSTAHADKHKADKKSTRKPRNMTRELGAFFADMRAYFARVDKFALREEDENEKKLGEARLDNATNDDDGEQEHEDEERGEDYDAFEDKPSSLGKVITTATTGGKGGLPSVAEEAGSNTGTTKDTTSAMRAYDAGAVSRLEKSIARRKSSMGMSRRLSLVLQAKDGDRDTPLRRKLSFASRTSLASALTPSRLSFGGAGAVGARLSSVDGEHADTETVREGSLGGVVLDIDKKKKKISKRMSHLDALDEAHDESAPGATGTILEEVEELDADGHGDDVDESSIGLSGISLLMKACEQDSIKSADALPSLHDFVSSFVAPPSPDTAPATQTATDADGASFLRKIGEGTFGEAFKGADGSVFKIVPIEGTMLVNGELQKSAEDIIPEVVVARSLSSLRCRSRTSSEVSAAFVELRGSAVCRGKYPRELLDAWHAWDAEHTSENDCPKIFGSEQHYIVFVFADGGRDLERFKVNTFEEARSIIMQTAMALAVAEAACRFEHRDLHWGNLLITRTADDGLDEIDENVNMNRTIDAHEHASTSLQCRLNGVDIDMVSAGVKVTLIDFTLSRIDNGADCAFCDLALDPELFKGPARDPQADSYRRMKKLTKNDWSAHCPKTNVVWLQYLSEVMLSMKDIGLSAAERRDLKTFKKRIGGYERAGEVVWDAFFKGAWRSVTGHGNA